MKALKILTSITLILLLAFLAFKVVNTTRINDEHHALYRDNLRDALRDADALEAEMLRVEKGQRLFYDFVEFRLQELKRRFAAIAVVPVFVDDKNAAEIQSKQALLNNSYPVLDKQVQTFKRYFSLFRNSRNYLPQMLNEYQANSAVSPIVLGKLSEIAFRTFEIISLNADGATREQALEDLASLKASVLALNTPVPNVQMFFTHAEIILLYDKKLRDTSHLLDNQLIPEVLDTISEINSTYHGSYAITRQAQQNSDTLVYIVGAALLLLVLIAITSQLYTKHKLERALKDFSKTILAQSEGDFSQQVSGHYKGALATLKESINTTSNNLKHALGDVSQVSHAIRSSANHIAEFSTNYESEIHVISESIDTSRKYLGAVRDSSLSFSEQTTQADQTAAKSSQQASAGAVVMNDTVQAMQEILQAATQMQTIINNIDSIAFQTNLLALNAAVEAARAGEHGAGFAVVAGEVRNLSKRTTDASNEIRELINISITKIENGSELMEKTHTELSGAVVSIQEVSDAMAGIKTSNEQQTGNISQANNAIVEISEQMKNNLDSFKQASEMAKASLEQTSNLDQLVAKFKLN